MAAPEYYHQPLENPSSQIRLLKVLPSSDRNTLVEATIAAYTIPDPKKSRRDNFRTGRLLPPYSALSYVCGSGKELEKTKHILIEGRPFPVTEKVYAALRLGRSHASTAIYIWVDSICISQTDLGEKSKQILLLQRIYLLATLVYVWLYPLSPDGQKALRFIQSLVTHPTLLKVSDKFLQQYESHEASAKEGNVQQRIREAVVRNGYSIVLSSTLRALSATQMAVTTMYEYSDFNATPLETTYQYVEQYTFAGGKTARNQRIGQRRLQVHEQRLLQEKIPASETHLSDLEELHYQNLDLEEPMSYWNSWKAKYSLELQKKNRERQESRKHLEPISSTKSLPQPSPKQGDSIVKQPQGSDKTPSSVKRTIEAEWTPQKKVLESMTTQEMIRMAQLVNLSLLKGSEYFSRMWTMQEPIVARATAFLSEKDQVPFVDFLTAVTYLQRTFDIDMSFTKEINQLQWISDEWHVGARLRLRTLLYESCKRQCFDPRDKIYALLGLIYDKPTILVQPDYTLSVEQVYANACRFIIASDRSLDVICATAHTQSKQHRIIEGLPSWCPNFLHFGNIDDEESTTPLIDLSGRNNIYHASVLEKPAEQETSSILPTIWTELKVTGICLRSICKLSQHDEDFEQNPKDWRDVELRWRATIMPKKSATAVEKDCLNALSRLMGLYDKFLCDGELSLDDEGIVRAQLMDVCLTLISGLSSQKMGDQDRLKRYMSTLICGRSSSITRCTIDDIVKLLKAATEASDIAGLKTLCNAIKSGLRNRRLFTLGDEDIIGACPINTRVGDIVVVLLGCNVPVILRAVAKESYELIGECYCHGLMDGEALKLRDDGVLPVKEYRLR